MKQEFDLFSNSTWDGFKDYSRDTSKDVTKTWESTTKDMKNLTAKSLWGTVSAWFDDDMHQVENIWDNAWNSMIGSADKAWDGFLNRAVNRAWSGVGGIFDKVVMDPASDWLSGALGLSGSSIHFNDKMEDFFAAVEMGDSYWEALNTADILPTGGITKAIASWFGGSEPAVAETVSEALANSASLFDFGSQASLYGTEVVSESMANSAALFDFGSQPSLGSGLGAGLATPLGAFGLALAPGMVGMLFHDEISGLLGMDTDPMTPEEAISNWQGQENFLAGLSGNIAGAGQEWAELAGTQFGLFGQAAQEAAEDLERLRTVAGYTQEQLDGVVASLDPLSQELVTSGQAANTLEDEVRQLAVEIHAAANSMALTDQATIQFNGRIDDLAGRLGLSGDAAQEFKSALYGLADGFSAGGEEAAGFEAALDAFTQGTLASLTSGAEGSREAIQGLISSMKGVSGASGISVEDMGDGTTRFTAMDYASGGTVDNLGLYHAGSGGNAAYGYYHSGGLVAGWPKAHAGALISSLARDEVPLVARRGEYVVRAEAVNAATLPALKALNQGGGMAGGDMQVNFTINLNGNLMGNDDQIEDMVRLIESRLRQLKSSRWGA
ncbi:MAG: hypothetical protein KQH53_15450 [Desulfarculaceae bacterium]|nr:hypothetical protein [Desulfarculaceae bacterium]